MNKIFELKEQYINAYKLFFKIQIMGYGKGLKTNAQSLLM